MIRGNRKITLTEDGMLLRKRAEEILDLVGRTEKEIAQSDETVSGDLYIGTGETDGVRQIARTAHQLQESHPGIRFHIVSGDAVDVCERLDKGLLDFGVLLGDMDKAKYNYLELPMKDTWGVLMQRRQPSGGKDRRLASGPVGQAPDPVPAGGQQGRIVPLAQEGAARSSTPWPPIT